MQICSNSKSSYLFFSFLLSTLQRQCCVVLFEILAVCCVRVKSHESLSDCISPSDVKLSVNTTYPKVIYLTVSQPAAKMTDRPLSLRISSLCPGTENVLNTVKTNLVFHNHSWDFLQSPNVWVTLSPVAAGLALSYIWTLSGQSHSAGPSTLCL